MKEANQKNKLITLRRNNYFIADKVKGKTIINSREIIILIHGYNVSEEGAKEAYTKFQDNFDFYCKKMSALNQVIYWFLWPSDKANKLDSIVCYYKTVRVAKICGKKLGEYLNKLQLKSSNNQPPRIILIGHSLGCRLLLEALKRTKKDNKNWEIFLMAAAVPVNLIEAGELLDLKRDTRENYNILYSKNDLVLTVAFPPGQRLAGEGSWEAVGLKGNPNSGVWSKRKEVSYDHSGYWKGEEAAEWISLQLGVFKTTSRKVKTDRPSLTSRSRDISWRTIGERERKLYSRSLLI
ncbi:MAG: alpha/beta hydrolase [Crocosphaera sp.]|nr:alpha/beta hydrolase [Crocosphaera sp.]